EWQGHHDRFISATRRLHPARARVGQLGATGSRHGGWVSMLLDEWIRKGNCKSHSRYARSSAMRSWIMDQMCQRRTTTIRKSLATVVLFGVASLAQAQSAPGAA